ncbi:hypothetical protein Lser_V15G26197 [Lactuca serriola]
MEFIKCCIEEDAIAAFANSISEVTQIVEDAKLRCYNANHMNLLVGSLLSFSDDFSTDDVDDSSMELEVNNPTCGSEVNDEEGKGFTLFNIAAFNAVKSSLIPKHNLARLDAAVSHSLAQVIFCVPQRHCILNYPSLPKTCGLLISSGNDGINILLVESIKERFRVMHGKHLQHCG